MSTHDPSTVQTYRDMIIGAARMSGLHRGIRHGSRILVTQGTSLTIALILLVQPVVAQSANTAFCETAIVQTIMNLFSVIQLGGPLLGGVVALGATVSLPMVRRSDLKREIKEVRNQGILWGVIVAPLGTVIIQFLLNNVVAGAPSCSF